MMKKLLFSVLLLLMTAIGAVAQNQLNEGFESTTFPPDDWTTIHVSGTNSFTRSTSYSYTGDACAYMAYASAGHENYLVTPMLIPAADEALSFYISGQSWSGTTITIEVSTTTATASAFTTTLATYTSGSGGTLGTTSLTTFVRKTISASVLEPYVGQQIYIAFHVVDNNGSHICIDDVSGVSMYVPTCPQPTSLTANNLTTTTADIEWVPAGTETNWTLKYGPAGFNIETAGTTENVSGTPAFQITGLTANTAYDVYVKAICGEGDESLWKNASFRTACDAITSFPWTENFESYNYGEFSASCWENEHITGDGTSIFSVYTSTNGTNSTHQLRLPDMSSGTMTKLALPEMSLSNENVYIFGIDVYRNTNTSNYGEGIRVFASSDGNIEGATELGFISRSYTTSDTEHGIPAETTSGWYSYNLRIPFTGTCYIILRGESKYGSATYMDNFVVREASHSAEILTYSLPTQVADATINSENGEIAVTVAFTTDLNSLAPVYTISAGAEISAPIVSINGESCTVEYDVTAEDGTTIKHWTVTVTKAPVSHDAFITAFTFAGQKAGSEATIISDTENGIYTVNAVAEWNTNITTIAPTVTISDNATVDPESGVAQDFTNSVTYRVTAEDGTTINAYTVTIVNDPDACINPATVNVTDITTTTATLGWAQAYTETSYLVKVSTIAMTDMTATADVFDGTVDATTKALEGLAANTEYYVYVQSSCDNAEGWTSTTFTTLCEAVAEFPWSEDFSSVSAPALPSCWSYIDANNDGDYWQTNNNAVRLYTDYNNGNNDDYLILPAFELNGSYLFSYDVKANSTSEPNDYKVVLSTTGFAAEDFNVVLQDLETVGYTSYQTKNITLNNYNGTVYIAMYVPQGGLDGWILYFDNFNLRELSTAAEILTYSLPTQVEEATITSGDDAGTIDITVTNSTDFETLAPSYTISEYATISDPVITGEGDARVYTYTVTAEAGNTKVWTVNITKAPLSHDAFITAFTFAGQKAETTAEIVSENDTYTVNAVAEWNVDLTNIAPTVTVSPAATVVPESGVAQDFTSPVTYTVTAEDGTTINAYTVTIVNDPDACINPAAVSVTDITTTTATLGWAQSYTETSYLVKVATEAMTDMTATADVFDGTVEATTKALEGLNANTQYFVYVQSVCDNAEGWVSANFTTLCDVVAEFPFTEGFESITRPDCWTEETTGTHYWTFGLSGSSDYYTGAHSGNYNASYRHVSSGDKAKLVSPVFDFGEITGAVLEFWRKNPSWSGDIDYLKVYYRTAGDAEWTLLESYTDASSDWTKETITLVNLSSTYQIAFEANDNYGYGMGLDDVLIRELSHEAEILTYSLPTQVEEATITSGDDAGTIDVTVFNSTDFETLVPSYTISEYATINDPVITGEGDARIYTYTVTAEAGNTKVWTVNITKAPVSTDALITAFTFAGQKEGTTAEIVSDAETSTYTVNAVADWYIDLSYIVPTVTVSPAATVVPESGVAQDFTADEAVTYTVTAEDGETSHTYTVTIVNDPDACVNPDFVSVSNIATTTATIAWEQAYTETSYRVKVSTTAMSNMTATANVFDETVDEITVTLEGLTANTLYYVYVQSNCDNAEGWTISSFKTSCEPIAELPYEEGFEGTLYVTPDCWTKVGDGYATANDYYVNTGSSAMMFYGVTGGNIIALPQFEENISSLALDFYTRPETNSYSACGTFEVGYITDLNDASSFVPVETYSYDDWSDAYFERKVVRMTSAPEGSYFAFNHKANSSSWYWFVDDVVVREFNTEAEIVDFNFPTRMSAPVINSEAGTVTTTASYQADLENLDEIVTVSDGAEYVAGATSIEGNVKTFAYTVTAEDGTTTKDWTVTVTKAESASTATDIIAFSFDDQSGESIIDTENHTVTAYAEWYFDLENNYITPTIEVSPMATISNDGEARNFFGSDETPVQYTVTAEDGTTTQIWNVTIVVDPNACVNPYYVDVYDVTENSATLYWNQMYLETSYLVKVSTTPMEDMTAEADVYDNVVTLAENENEITLPLTDLSAATAYYVYVQSNCDAEDWTETYFATECDGSAFSVPFVETFDATSGSKDCWNIVDANDDGTTWDYTQDYAYQQEVAVYSYSSYNDANDWLVSPKISIVDGSALTFDYWTDPAYTEKFSVYVITDLENYATTATQILPTQTILRDNNYTGVVPPAIYSLENIDLSAYAGQEIYIGIKCESEADQDVLFIDNFTVALPVYTITATAGENGTIDPESAEVTYGTDKMFTITPAEGYRIATVVVDAETDVTENVVAGAEAFFYTFTNVTANHTIHATFELIPTYTITVEAGENGNVYYNDALVSAPIVVTEGATPAFEITPATGYEIDVLTVGGNTVDLTEQQLGGFTYTFDPVMADITLTVTFVESVAVDMIEAGSMSIYPNPNNGMFSIDFSNIEGDATYQIIDARGAVVETRDINVMNGETMNFNHDLRPGAYFVRIINGDKVYVEQIVVE